MLLMQKEKHVIIREVQLFKMKCSENKYLGIFEMDSMEWVEMNEFMEK